MHDGLAHPLVYQQAELPGVAAAGLTLGDVIGMGGQAVVRSAQQLALRRGVTVKAARRTSPATRAALLREAWVAGGLEHPNILPIHALGADREGAPLLFIWRR